MVRNVVSRLPIAEIGKRFQADGFIIVPQLVTEEEAVALKAEARRVLDTVRAEAHARGETPSFEKNGVFVGVSVRSEKFRQLNRDPRLLDVLEPIIGPNILFWSDKIVFKSEETDFGTPWHQDWPYWKGAHKVSLWLALDPADETNGCLKVVRGSHKLPVDHDAPAESGPGFRHRIAEDRITGAQVVAAPVPAGGAVIFHDLTLHASFPNTSGRDRWVVVSTFKDPLLDDLDYPQMTAATLVRGRGRE